MEAEPVQQTDTADSLGYTSAPIATPSQEAPTLLLPEDASPAVTRATHTDRRGKQLLSKYADRARKRRVIRDLRKRVVTSGA